MNRLAANLLPQILHRWRRHRLEIGWVSVGQAMAFLGGFLGIKALTRTLGPAAYGEFALGLTVSGLIFGFVYAPFASAALRYYSVYRDRNALPAFFKVMLKLHLLAMLGCIFVGAMAALVTAHYLGIRWGMLILVGAFVGITNGTFTTAYNIHSAMRRRSLAALHQGADAWLRPLFAVLFVFALERNGAVALSGCFFGSFLVMSSEIAFLWHGIRNRKRENLPGLMGSLSDSLGKDIHAYILPLVMFAAFGWTNTYADRWFIQVYRGLRDVGIYAALFQIANAPMNILSGLLGQLFTPIIFERAGNLSHPMQFERSGRLFRLTIGLAGFGYLTMTAGAFLFGRPLVRFLTTSEFATQAKLLWVLVLGLSLYNFCNLLTYKGMYHNVPRIYLSAKMAYAVIFVILAYLSVPRWGLGGMVWTWVIASFLYMLLILYVNVISLPTMLEKLTASFAGTHPADRGNL